MLTFLNMPASVLVPVSVSAGAIARLDVHGFGRSHSFALNRGNKANKKK